MRSDEILTKGLMNNKLGQHNTLNNEIENIVSYK